MAWKHQIPNNRFVTKGMGKDPVPGIVEIEVDWETLARVLGRKAAANGSGKSKLACGITVKWMPQL